MKTIIVLVNGLGRSGKSEFCKQCKEYAERNQLFAVSEISTVDYVKEVAKFCGWDGGKTSEDRVFLSDVKKALEKWNDIPIKKIVNKIDEIDKQPGYEYGHLIMLNAREEKDIKRIKELFYDVVSIKITNNKVENNEVPELIDYINSCETDYIIENNGTLEELKESAETFVNIMRSW